MADWGGGVRGPLWPEKGLWGKNGRSPIFHEPPDLPLHTQRMTGRLGVALKLDDND